nr:2953_t:CDS:2 [Entrophospora candida]
MDLSISDVSDSEDMETISVNPFNRTNSTKLVLMSLASNNARNKPKGKSTLKRDMKETLVHTACKLERPCMGREIPGG